MLLDSHQEDTISNICEGGATLSVAVDEAQDGDGSSTSPSLWLLNIENSDITQSRPGSHSFNPVIVTLSSNDKDDIITLTNFETLLMTCDLLLNVTFDPTTPPITLSGPANTDSKTIQLNITHQDNEVSVVASCSSSLFHDLVIDVEENFDPNERWTADTAFGDETVAFDIAIDLLIPKPLRSCTKLLFSWCMDLIFTLYSLLLLLLFALFILILIKRMKKEKEMNQVIPATSGDGEEEDKSNTESNRTDSSDCEMHSLG